MSSPYGPSGNDPQQPWPPQQQPPAPGFPGQQAPQQPGFPPPGQGEPGQFGQPGQQFGQPQPGSSPYGQPGQQGQPGQPQQGWGPPPGQQPQQQPNWGAFPPPQQQQPGDPGAPKKKLPIAWILGGIVALAVIVVLLFGFLIPPKFLASRVFDETAVARDTKGLLINSYKIEKVESVSCPAGQEVKEGKTFSCTATINGQKKEVPITVKDDSGTYEVGQPK
ncbi:DUF4333 domain-containing protein [Pseudonocardiaceae bacterium YIM PH 21723]|nr:DUF4333 domain-containing protein [Pseudonocardiaceae bacterium YIM PH 21723]